MGEIKKKESTVNKITARENKRQENVHRENETIQKLSSNMLMMDFMLKNKYILV